MFPLRCERTKDEKLSLWRLISFSFSSYTIIQWTWYVLSTTFRPNLPYQMGALAIVDICEQALMKDLKLCSVIVIINLREILHQRPILSIWEY